MTVKKLNYLIMTVVLLCFTLLMLVGCGKKGLTVEDLVGTWTFYEETSDGSFGMDITYEFNADGTMSTSYLGKKMKEGTYTIDGNRINYTTKSVMNDSTNSGSLNVELGDGYFIVTYDSGMQRTFYKV
jgi:uncharacterized protein (TIGR03066 family)